MNSSCFFPNLNDSKNSGLQQCLATNLPVFSKDVSAQGHKMFFACGYKHFVEQYYPNQKKKHFYEVLRYDVPTKLFFDFDQKVEKMNGMSLDVFYSFVKDFVLNCKKKIESKWRRSNIDVLLLDASTDEKHSCHAVFDFFFYNMLHLKEFAEDMVKQCVEDKSQKKIVDLCVYSRNRCFRLVYSSKWGKSNALLAEKNVDYGEYDATLVMKSLIQTRLKPNKGGSYSLIHQPVYTFVDKNKKRRRDDIIAKTFQKVPPILEQLLSQKQYLVLSAKKDKDNNFFFILKGCRCPWKNAKHKNNNTYMFLNKHGYARFRCADEECPKYYFLKQDFKFALI